MGNEVRGSRKGRGAHTRRPEAVGGSEDKVPQRWRPRESGRPVGSGRPTEELGRPKRVGCPENPSPWEGRPTE